MGETYGDESRILINSDDTISLPANRTQNLFCTNMSTCVITANLEKTN